jgi:hypothetical protein
VSAHSSWGTRAGLSEGQGRHKGTHLVHVGALRDSLLDFEDKRGPLLGAPVAKPTDDAPFLLVGHPLRHNMVREEKAATRIRHSRPLFGSNQSDLRFNYREHGGVKIGELSDETRVVKSQQQQSAVSSCVRRDGRVESSVFQPIGVLRFQCMRAKPDLR